MKKYLLLFLLCGAMLFCKEAKYGDLIRRAGLWYEKDADIPFTGSVIVNTFIKDVIERTWLNEGESIRGTIHSNDGFLLREWAMKGGIPEGPVKRYDPARKTYNEQFCKNSVLYDIGADTPYEGLLTEYYPDGQIRNETNIKNGISNGLAKYYYQSGVLMMEVTFKNGVYHGHRNQYHRNGNIAAEDDFVDGVRGGIRKLYYESGALSGIQNIKNNLLEGEEIQYYENGDKKAELNWKNHKKDGTQIEYFPKEKKLRKELWVKGTCTKVFPPENIVPQPMAGKQLPWLKAKYEEAVNKN
ncbi:MAG: toxin-antitoxin system YwqK family antitoxin [Fusobacteriaceae bacterium]|jgi:antitoxin component YwqK of YwqJK toxin-antitoxin module|nr:toxin-antitoxin system YwqK family antitoxin [Fusobacteriaceae bacterium]